MCLLESNAGSRLTVMRWDSLRLDSSDGHDHEHGHGEAAAGYTALPLIERGMVARTFDTPEFQSTRS